MEKILLPLGFLLACIFIARLVGEKPLRELTDDEKVALIDCFAGARFYMGLPLYALLFAFLVAMYSFPERYILTFGLFIGLFVVYQIGITVWSVGRLRRIEISAQYIRIYVIARTIMLIGFFGMFGLLFLLTKR